MDKKRILLKDLPKVDPFKVPEGYFENFKNGIMSQLQDVDQEKSTNVNLWHRVRPWIYMAAMFTGIALMIRVFVYSPTHSSIKTYSSGGLNLSSSSDIEDYYNYYEDGLARIAYDDTFYLADFSEYTE
jgi:hypothetical protein